MSDPYDLSSAERPFYGSSTKSKGILGKITYFRILSTTTTTLSGYAKYILELGALVLKKRNTMPGEM